MDRSNPYASGQRSDTTSASQSPGPFAYQTRLLERTASRGSTVSLSRSSSQTGKAVLPSSTGTSATRKWTPTHRVGSSLDVVRGKWEAMSNPQSDDTGNTIDSVISRTPSISSVAPAPSTSVVTPTRPTRYTSILSSARSKREEPVPEPEYRTPIALKRRTLPDPIIASPLSPNTTGVTVENPDSPTTSFSTPVTARIHLPVSTPLHDFDKHHDTFSSTGSRAQPASDHITPFRSRRANTIDSVNPALTGSSTASEVGSVSSSTSRTSFALSDAPSVSHRRPTSLYGATYSFTQSSPDKSYISRTPARSSSASPTKQLSSPEPPASNVMFPKSSFKSSYMQGRNASKYGDTLGTGRRLGRHLPRIASGDGPEEPVVEPQKDEEPPPKLPDPPDNRRYRREERQVRTREWQVPPSPEKDRYTDIVVPGIGNGDDVVGIPGRVRLARDKAAPTSPTAPLPSSRFTRGLWADVQRNLIQAYEYLCHVGEAQQWIEGCLDEELGFGVVEMEEGLRNGVVLARLVRWDKGEAAVRKIYEAPKLDFRHSDNINHFLDYVRNEGLPESFIFELTDLYEKKNFPKVIYCIHALSHLLARRGRAERIGNLLGQLQFSDDQLQQTQKGLKESGVAMPNFGNVGRELAKEFNEQPEEEPEEPQETEYERRDRLLNENTDSIIACQAIARSFLVKKAQATQHVRIRLAERYVPKIQAHARAALTRRQLRIGRKERAHLGQWAIALQAHSRGLLFRKGWRQQLRRIRALSQVAVKIQAQVRGVLQRRKYQKFRSAMRNAKVSVVKLQSLARAKIAQRTHQEVAKTFTRPVVMRSIVAFQAHARGALLRMRMRKHLQQLTYATSNVAKLQGHGRGLLVRRRVRTQLATLDNATDVVVRIQAAARTYLARKRLLILIRGLRKATPAVVTLQARARANLARRRHDTMQKALSEVKIITSVGGLQSLARAALARNRHREQTKRLEFAEPNVVGFQSVARGALVRMDYHAWRDFLHRSHPHATILQAMLRGVMQRRKFRQKMQYYRSNLDKIVQIQSLYRAKETREQYRQLTLGTNVSVGTIKNFVHLLDDSEADFQEEIKVERLRTEVVKRIRENQALESHVSDLDTKIALVVQNVKSFEEVLKVRRKYGGDSAAVHAARASVLAAHGDPFSGSSSLDHSARRKLELYQQLFYVLQTKGEYLTHLLARAAEESDWEKNRRLIEHVVLSLFGYGTDRREDYLIVKFFQTAIHDEIMNAPSLQAITRGHPSFINIVVHYARTKQALYVRETLQTVIREVIESDELDLEADPSVIYRTRLDLEETRSGIASTKPRDLPFHQAAKDPDTRAEYIRHLQLLVGFSKAFVSAIIQSTARMPFAIRFLARETLAALRFRFPETSNEIYATCIARLVFYRFINPAIITPEIFDIVSHTIDIASRKNLAQISRVLTQITTGIIFAEECYVPINEFVAEAIQDLSAWMIEVANVQDAETHFNAHEFLDATVEPKAIAITPNEVYTMHSILLQHLDAVAPTREDPLRAILTELDGVPNIGGNDELNDARDSGIKLQLSNRFADVQDPKAAEKASWVQAKRAVLAILRVHPAQDLVESLMLPVTDDHQLAWEQVIEDTNRELVKHQRRMPSTTGADSAYRLDDIQSMNFKQVKARAIEFLLQLEKKGKISRQDGYQGILNAIAGDVRSKNRRRVQRQHEKESLQEAMRDLEERKRNYEEQITSYHNYVETAMSTMQRGKGKKRFTLPFTKQYFHLRDLQKAGKSPQFGSFKYSAQHFYDKGILLSIDQYSPRQFDKMDIVLSSNSVGVFTIEILNNALGITNRVAVGDIKMEDLLQAQFENRASLSLFNGLAKFNLNLLLWQINKKFYV